MRTLCIDRDPRPEGSATLAAGANKVIRTPVLSLTGTGRLDLKDNKLMVKNGVLGSWNGAAYSGIAGLIAAAIAYVAVAIARPGNRTATGTVAG